MQTHWELGTWWGIPVSMHWSVLFACAWLFFLTGGLVSGAIASVAFVILMMIHESGHVLFHRWKRIPVATIELSGVHGTTTHGWLSPADETFVAWGGVAAQLVVLLVALVLPNFVNLGANALVMIISSPVLFVFINVNIFLIVVALLPIGPFDGHAAWGFISQMKARRRQRRARAQELLLHPERGLSVEKRRELEESSGQEAAALIERLGGKPQDRKDGP